MDPAEPLIGKGAGRTRVLASHDLEGGAAESDIALGLRAGRQEYLGRPDAASLKGLYT